jgi:hypothetical protein
MVAPVEGLDSAYPKARELYAPSLPPSLPPYMVDGYVRGPLPLPAGAYGRAVHEHEEKSLHDVQDVAQLLFAQRRWCVSEAPITPVEPEKETRVEVYDGFLGETAASLPADGAANRATARKTALIVGGFCLALSIFFAVSMGHLPCLPLEVKLLGFIASNAMLMGSIGYFFKNSDDTLTSVVKKLLNKAFGKQSIDSKSCDIKSAKGRDSKWTMRESKIYRVARIAQIFVIVFSLIHAVHLPMYVQAPVDIIAMLGDLDAFSCIMHDLENPFKKKRGKTQCWLDWLYFACVICSISFAFPGDILNMSGVASHAHGAIDWISKHLYGIFSSQSHGFHISVLCVAVSAMLIPYLIKSGLDKFKSRKLKEKLRRITDYDYDVDAQMVSGVIFDHLKIRELTKTLQMKKDALGVTREVENALIDGQLEDVRDEIDARISEIEVIIGYENAEKIMRVYSEYVRGNEIRANHILNQKFMYEQKKVTKAEIVDKKGENRVKIEKVGGQLLKKHYEYEPYSVNEEVKYLETVTSFKLMKSARFLRGVIRLQVEEASNYETLKIISGLVGTAAIIVLSRGTAATEDASYYAQAGGNILSYLTMGHWKPRKDGKPLRRLIAYRPKIPVDKLSVKRTALTALRRMEKYTVTAEVDAPAVA